ncbi:peptidylprolyl isomerase [bacterium]|nr:peptidylprolyl isomerase [bacterium]MBU1985196.1 peptidylprolyl isomerase [bacterium]
MKIRNVISMGLAMLFVIAGCGPKEEIVAKVGREKITASEFKDSFVNRYRGEENAKNRSYPDREQAVREMAIERAKYQEAVARGYDKLPEATEQIEKIARRKALDMLYEEKIMNAVITDAAAKDFYDKSGVELKARHILLRTVTGDSTKDSATVKTRMDSIHQAIKKGLDFKAAAKTFSEDATSAADSGDLGWFPWGRMVDEFQTVAWKATPGQIAGPVQTNYGYHLILVEDKRPVQGRTSYEESREQIKSQLRQVFSTQLMETARAYVENLREKRKLEMNTENMEVFRQRLLDPGVSKTQDISPVFTEDQKALVVATYSGGKVTIADLIEKVGQNAARANWADEQTMKDLIHSIAEPVFLEADAEQQGLYRKALRDPEVEAQKRRAMARHLEKMEVTDKVNPTEDDEKRYYENHLAEFVQPEMRTIREIFIKEDSAKAARVRERALKGENFTKLARQFNEKESTKADTGRLGPFEETRFGLIGKTAFIMQKTGEVSQVVPVGKNYSVIQLLEMIPSRTKTWAEAQTEAKRKCRQTMTENAQKALDEMVLGKYKLDVQANVLAAVWPLPEDARKDKLAREP